MRRSISGSAGNKNNNISLDDSEEIEVEPKGIYTPEEEEKIEGDLDEEEITYLKDTGKFFVLDSLRQLGSLFVDLRHNFAEVKLKKQEKKRGLFNFRKSKKNNDSSDSSD